MNNLLLKKKEGRPSLRGRTSLALLRAYQRRTTANRDAQLSRRRSRVRVPSLPFTRVPANRHLLLSIQARVRAPTLIVCCPSCRARLNPKREESAPRWGHKEKDHHERKDEPMKLTTMTQVTVDGVMQGNGGASDEDRRNGFERGGWAMGVADNETMTSSTRPTSAPTRSCSAGGPTSSSPATGAQRSGLAPRRKIRATTRSQLP